MSNMTDPDSLQPLVRTCQIIVAALVAGVVMFMVITLFVTQMAMNPAPGPGQAAGLAAAGSSPLQIITYLAVAVSLMNLVLSFVVPRLVADQARRKIALERPGAVTKNDPSGSKQLYLAGYTGGLAQLYVTQLIIGAALLEGAAFFTTIAFMLERNPIALIATLVLVGTLIARFPTEGRVNSWLDRQLELLQEDRQSAI